MSPPLGLKAQAVDLVVAAMREDGAPRWAIDATVRRLNQHVTWHDWLTIASYAAGPQALWSDTCDQKWTLQGELEARGRPFWTTPVGEILDDYLWRQYLNFRDEPFEFDEKFPPPREAVGQS